ncbi:MAG TPA: energy-coupling factor transporter ATPase [Desulfurococcales archaeon]|nr:energy-coupling factor transporter ATPase [Desulfurococcales archaeon]
MRSEPIIKVENVYYRYPPNIWALKGVSLNIYKQEFIALLGQNGSGKTTLAKHLNGLLVPTRGRVLVKGIDTRKLSVAKIARIVGYVFQNPEHQIFAKNIYEEIAFGLRNIGVPEEEIEDRVREALEEVDLRKPLDTNPHFLSTGEKHRLAIASVLAMKPEVIILDEPTTGLDYKRIKQLMEIIYNLYKKGHTIILITHDMALAAEYCERAIILHNGRILVDAPAREVFSNIELLAQSSLKPPQITLLSIELNRRGYPIPRDILTVKEMADKITSLLKTY